MLGVEGPDAELAHSGHAVAVVQGRVLAQRRAQQALAVEYGELGMARKKSVALVLGDAGQPLEVGPGDALQRAFGCPWT